MSFHATEHKKEEAMISRHDIAKWMALPLVLVLAGLLSGGESHAQEVALRLHNFNAPKAIANRLFMMPWAAELEKTTGGRLKVQIFPAMQLGGKPSDLYGQARDGVVDIIWTVPEYTAGRFPLTEVFELPFVAGSAEATSQAMNEFYGKWLKEEYQDTHPLVFHSTAPALIHTATRPLRSLDDFKGMKIRGPSRVNTEVLEALGGVPVGMPIPQVYEALSRGLVEGAWVPWTIMRPFRLLEVTKYHTEVDMAPVLFVMTMNKAKYESLPPDLKKAIDDSTGMPLAKRLGKMWDEDEKPGRAIAVKKGDEIVQLSAAETERWKAAVQPVVDAWVKRVNGSGKDGTAMIADAKRLVAKYSK
jgi:TRAP-type C4-dicarboxylate transport system substrate-binding protein